MTRKQLENLIQKYSNQQKLAHRLERGYLDGKRKVWYVTPFGGHAFEIGATLADAGQYMRELLNRDPSAF